MEISGNKTVSRSPLAGGAARFVSRKDRKLSEANLLFSKANSSSNHIYAVAFEADIDAYIVDLHGRSKDYPYLTLIIEASCRRVSAATFSLSPFGAQDVKEKKNETITGRVVRPLRAWAA